MDLVFDSLNAYENMEAVTGRDYADLLVNIKAIRTPIKIVEIVSHRNKLIAFIMGDIRKKRTRQPKKEVKNGS